MPIFKFPTTFVTVRGCQKCAEFAEILPRESLFAFLENSFKKFKLFLTKVLSGLTSFSKYRTLRVVAPERVSPAISHPRLPYWRANVFSLQIKQIPLNSAFKCLDFEDTSQLLHCTSRSEKEVSCCWLDSNTLLIAQFIHWLWIPLKRRVAVTNEGKLLALHELA